MNQEYEINEKGQVYHTYCQKIHTQDSPCLKRIAKNLVDRFQPTESQDRRFMNKYSLWKVIPEIIEEELATNPKYDWR